MIVYEYPFNEHVRTLLRMEDLYEKFIFFLHKEHALEHHVAISTIFDILDVVGRNDLKSELLLELERQRQTLQNFKTNPHVETKLLDAVLQEIERTSSTLMASQGKTGQNIRDNEWLMSIRGRTSIPGGACKFDLPSYYTWQQRTSAQRIHDISEWISPLVPLLDTVNLVLKLLRQSGHTTTEQANAGSYQQMLQGKTYHMLRLTMPQKTSIIPEISANKYMLWIRFMSQDELMKFKPCEHDVSFELTLCNF